MFCCSSLVTRRGLRPACGRTSSLPRSNQIEIAADVIVGAGGNLVLVNLFFCAGAVLGVNLLVPAPAKPLLGRPQNHFAAARPLPGIDAGRLNIQRAHLRVGALAAHHVGIVALAPGMTLVAFTTVLVPFLSLAWGTLPLALTLSLATRHLQNALPSGADRPRLALFLALPLLTFALVSFALVLFAVGIARGAALLLAASALPFAARLPHEATQP